MRFPLASSLLPLLSIVASLHAQPVLEFETVRTSGEVPYIPAGTRQPDSTLAGFSLDPIGGRLHWIFRNDWYRLDIRTGTWTRIPFRNRIGLNGNRWGVVPGTMKILAWDDGLGRVIRIDSTGNPTRIDQSFNQKTQYAHLSHLAPDGTIHAIGGIGMHHPKNYGVAFSEASGGWHRLAGDDGVTNDPFLRHGFILKDPAKNELLLITEFGEAADPTIRGLLAMDLDNGRIRVLHRNLLLPIQFSLYNIGYYPISSVRTGVHRFGFVKASSRNPSSRASDLLAVDFDTYRVLPVQARNPNNHDPSVRHSVLYYDESDSSLYSVQWSHITIAQTNSVDVSRAKVNVAAIRSALASGANPISDTDGSTDPIWPWQLAVTITLGGWVWMWHRYRRRVRYPISEPVAIEGDVLIIDIEPLRINNLLWADRFGSNFSLEANLLEILAKAFSEGRPVVGSDVVERLLIPNHPSLDYIRKTRNLTRKRLEESLQAVRPLPDGEAYILTDRDITDKRKSRLQLNSRWITVNPLG